MEPNTRTWALTQEELIEVPEERFERIRDLLFVVGIPIVGKG